ncbi:uncharacterized protein LOC114322076 [Camellia sinensis]|uniref:uncharacterized protein LOC114322076 n=1 Tax=Camellia sinensis TaxID=4442 RepID=UPI001036E78C|nr:uncharacterized protein LOC114322076 [Camellia sinensis]
MLEQLILIPYNIGYYWILLVIDLTLMIVYLLDPINSKINTSFEIVINTALKIYETIQRRRRTNPVWKVVQVINIIFSNFIILIFMLMIVQLDHNTLYIVSNNNENAFMSSPQQPTNVECGFYVMRYMKDLIRDQSILRKQNVR